MKATAANRHDLQAFYVSCHLVLAVSNCKMVDTAICLFSKGPRVYSITEDATTGSLMGSLSIPPRCRIAIEYIKDSIHTFFVVSGQLTVRMRLVRCGGKTARFCTSKGGAWQVPCGTALGMVNALPMPAQLVFWRAKAATEGASAGDMPARQSTGGEAREVWG
jgi:hypothetical protein